MPQPRRTQQERSATTRARVLEAAYDSLLEGGYAATTVGHVQQRAGVARGTLLHHFPTRGALLAGVVQDVVERRLAVLTTVAPDDDAPAADWDDVVDLVWTELQGDPFAVALELWVAARTDPDLRASLLPLQERLYATVHRSVTRLAGPDHPRTPVLVQFTIDLLTGSHLAGILQPRTGTDHVIEAWKEAVKVLAGDGSGSGRRRATAPGS